MPENPPDAVQAFLALNGENIAALTARVAAVEDRLTQVEAQLAAPPDPPPVDPPPS